MNKYKFTYLKSYQKSNIVTKYEFSKTYNKLKINNNIGLKSHKFNIKYTSNNIEIYSNSLTNNNNKLLLESIIDITNNIKNVTADDNYVCTIMQKRFHVSKNITNFKITNCSNYDYIVPYMLINSSNITDIYMNIYTKNNRKIETVRVENNEYLIINNKFLLYNFSDIKHMFHNYNFQNNGYLDILQIGINIT